MFGLQFGPFPGLGFGLESGRVQRVWNFRFSVLASRDLGFVGFRVKVFGFRV